MRPTLNPDSLGPSDWVLVEKLSTKLQRQYTRGEVVVLWWVLCGSCVKFSNNTIEPLLNR